MKTIIRGRFTTTGDEWEETANSKKEFDFVIDGIIKSECCYIEEVISSAPYAETVKRIVKEVQEREGAEHDRV